MKSPSPETAERADFRAAACAWVETTTRAQGVAERVFHIVEPRDFASLADRRRHLAVFLRVALRDTQSSALGDVAALQRVGTLCEALARACANAVEPPGARAA